MTAHRPVPHDTADEIRELEGEGFGRNTISMMTGISAGTVRNVLSGKAVDFCDDLTTRQRSNMLLAAFKPPNGR